MAIILSLMKKQLFTLFLLLSLAPLTVFGQSLEQRKAARDARRAEWLAKQNVRTAKRQKQELQSAVSGKAVDRAVVDIYGVMIDGYGDYYDWTPGLFRFTNNPADLTFTRETTGMIQANGAGVYVEGIYYVLDNGSQTSTMTAYDTENGYATVGSPITVSAIASDLTYDPTTGNVYGFFTTDGFNTWTFGTLNVKTGAITNIGATNDKEKVAIAAQKDGDIYALDLATGDMLSVNKGTGECTTIDNALFEFGSDANGLFGVQSAVFDWESDTYYWHVYDNFAESYLVAITLSGEGSSATIASQEVLKDYSYAGTYNDDYVVGLFIKQSGAVAGAPALATDLTPVFENGSLYGTLSFTMPTEDIDGNSLEGKTLGYEVSAGDQKKVGEALAGASVSVELTFTEGGNISFGVVVSDGAAKSQTATITRFVGIDTPATPTNIRFVVDGQRANLLWDAVTAGENGGYVGEVTYNVYRFPDNVKVGNGLTSNTFSETMESEIMTTYWYDIEAVAGDRVSARGTSPKNKVGTIFTVPYEETFDEVISLAGYSVADGNKDNFTWGYVTEDNTQLTVRQCLCYPSSRLNDADDWLFTPSIQLESDKVYKLSFTVQSVYDQVFSVWMGENGDISSMTDVIMSEQTLPGAYYTSTLYEVRVRPSKTGKFNFGFHCTTPMGSSEVYLDNIAVESLPITVPAAPTDLLVVAGEKGALNAQITFTVPSTNLGGNPIDAVSKITVVRDNVEIYTNTDVTPGQEISVQDNNPYNGMHTYGVYAENSYGAGEAAVVEKYIGFDAPCEIRNLKVVEDWKNNPGTIIATWDAPSEVGQHGGYVNPDEVYYYILTAGAGSDHYLGNVRTCSAQIDISNGQTIDGFSIYAENMYGSGKSYRQVASCMVGPALELPVYESFPGVSMKSGPWSHTVLSGETLDCNWYIYDGSLFESGTQDGDGGMMCFQATTPGNVSRLRSPKVDVRGAENPTFIFYIYHSGKADYVDVEVSKEYGDYVKVKTIAMNDEPKGWVRYELPLKDYADCAFLQIGLTGHAVESVDQVIPIDNFAFREVVDFDVEAGTLTAPREIKVGKTGEFTFTFANRGKADLAEGDYSIELYKNDVKCSTFPGPIALADRMTTTTLTDVPTIDDPNPSVYSAKLVYTADQNENNDVSPSASVRINMPLYPAADGLTATQNDNAIELVWNEPDMSTMQADPIVDDFESYNDFITSEIGPWKTIDRDGSIVKRVSMDGQTNLPYPDGNPMAYIVYNPLSLGIDLKSWRPFSGSKMLVAFSASRPSGTDEEAPQSNDWLISPELNGMRQTISFFTKAGHSAAIEELNVSYSSTDDNIESFLPANTQRLRVQGTSQWQEVRIVLPEGAKHFALNHVSTDQLALLLDDITYVPAGKLPEEVSLTGYNVYRNGEKVGEGLGDTYYEDTDVTNGETYTYKVTAVYDKGESVYSPEVTVVRTGINDVTTQNVSITSGAGQIFINGANGQFVSVYNAAGVEIFSEVADRNETIAAMPGVYAVRVAGKTVKVSVR